MAVARILLAAIVSLTALAAHAETLHGRVVEIEDGDTVTLLLEGGRKERVHLGGIDSPEKRQSFGQKAKAHLSDVAFGREADAECPKRDRHHRLVASSHQTARQRADYEQAEKSARNARLGLWQQLKPVPPWDWCKGQNLLD